jgi:hypothetical protein
MTCCRTISSIIPVVSEEASAVSPETYIIYRSELALARIIGQLVKLMVQNDTFWYRDRGHREGLEEVFLELRIKHCARALVLHLYLVGCTYPLFQVFHLEFEVEGVNIQEKLELWIAKVCLFGKQ